MPGSRTEAENIQAKPGESWGARKQVNAPKKSWGCIKGTHTPTPGPPELDPFEQQNKVE